MAARMRKQQLSHRLVSSSRSAALRAEKEKRPRTGSGQEPPAKRCRDAAYIVDSDDEQPAQGYKSLPRKTTPREDQGMFMVCQCDGSEKIISGSDSEENSGSGS